MTWPFKIVKLRSYRETRKGSRAHWPANLNVARLRGRPTGLYIRSGTRAVLVGWYR